MRTTAAASSREKKKADAENFSLALLFRSSAQSVCIIYDVDVSFTRFHSPMYGIEICSPPPFMCVYITHRPNFVARLDLDVHIISPPQKSEGNFQGISQSRRNSSLETIVLYSEKGSTLCCSCCYSPCSIHTYIQQQDTQLCSWLCQLDNIERIER